MDWGFMYSVWMWIHVFISGYKNAEWYHARNTIMWWWWACRAQKQINH
jgi:hypothetical protein